MLDREFRLKYKAEAAEKYLVMAFIYIGSLLLAAVSVSTMGATFSIFGLERLFSGAAMAVACMATALEFSKFVVAAFLHRTWDRLNILYRTYLLIAVVVLSGITSMGIFGFLSDAYQTSSVDLTANQIKIEANKAEQVRNETEINRILHDIEEIPNSRVTKKIQARKDAEPMIVQLKQKSEQLANDLQKLDLKNIEVKTKVGPLIYVARAFHEDVDTVVKWLILVFVGVFDPLAICLVIATSEALKMKQLGLLEGFAYKSNLNESVLEMISPSIASNSSNNMPDFATPVTANPPASPAPAQMRSSSPIAEASTFTKPAITMPAMSVDATPSFETSFATPAPAVASSQPAPVAAAAPIAAPAAAMSAPTQAEVTSPVATPAPAATLAAAPEPLTKTASPDDVVKMRFVDDDSTSEAS